MDCLKNPERKQKGEAIMKRHFTAAPAALVLAAAISLFASVTSAEARFIPKTSRICAGASSCAVLLDDGTVSCSLDTSEDEYISVNGEWYDWSDIADISMNEEILAAARKDGTVVWCGGRTAEYDWLADPGVMGVIDTWQDVVQVDAGPYDIAALKSDGSVEITGSIYTEDLEETTGFVQVCVYDALLCLREDGTVYCFAPWTYEGQEWSYDTSEWSGITQISAGYDHAAGLRSDGTVAATGSNEYGQCDTQSWSNIVQVAAGRFHTIGLKADGTAVCCGISLGGGEELNIGGWTDIVEISGFFDMTMGLRSDGSILCTGLPDRMNPAPVKSIRVN